MILAIDAQYNENTATIAGVLFESWLSPEAHSSFIKSLSDIAPYESGAFYKRELPCILSLLEDINEPIETIIVDGFVTLGAEHRKGLGMHLYESLHEKTIIIGVAKKIFKDTPKEYEIYRGNSAKPLYITAAGINIETAKTYIHSMAGKHRIPTLLKKADQLCRGINA